MGSTFQTIGVGKATGSDSADRNYSRVSGFRQIKSWLGHAQLQSSPPTQGLGRIHPNTAVGHGRLTLLATSPKCGGITVVDGQVHLVVMRFGTTTVFRATVSQHTQYGHFQFGKERHYAVVDQQDLRFLTNSPLFRNVFYPVPLHRLAASLQA